MKDLLVIIPTRGRKENVLRLYNHLSETPIDFLFCMDDDDPLSDELYPRVANLMVGPSKRLGPWLNEVSKQYVNMFHTIGFIGDDVMPRTDNWWEHIINSHKKNSIVYGNDGNMGEHLPTSVFMDSGLIKRLGYMVYPEFTHLYIDNHWKALGESLGTLEYLPDVYLEHLHPAVGKAKNDATYEAANSPDMYTKDGQTFHHYVEYILDNDVRKASN